MKRLACLISLELIFLAVFSAIFVGQNAACQFNILGTWQSSMSGEANPTRLRFGSTGIVTELVRHKSEKGFEWQARSKSTYKLDNPKAPKTMALTPADKNGQSSLNSILQITSFDDGLFVTTPAGASGVAPTRWTRVDLYRYFVVLAAGKGNTSFGGAGFAMLIKTDGVHTQRNAFGTYPVVNRYERYPVLAVIPARIRKQFDHEPKNDSGAMLRVEVTAGPYKRALEVLKTWERRADENALLYTVPYLNNAVYLNQLVSSLNETGVLTWRGGEQCSETIKLQKLTWTLSDTIMTKHNLTQTPYYLFTALRQLNAPLHLDDKKFYAALAGESSENVAVAQR
jgi:hypothetical protein